MRVELQAEVSGRRADLFGLVSTAAGLARWLDEAQIGSTVGAPFRLRLHDGVASGRVLAFDAPQHVSLGWEWEPATPAGVVAFDLIDHGARTHLTLRHVGLRSAAQRELHEEMWRYWFDRLVRAAREGPTGSEAR